MLIHKENQSHIDAYRKEHVEAEKLLFKNATHTPPLMQKKQMLIDPAPFAFCFLNVLLHRLKVEQLYLSQTKLTSNGFLSCISRQPQSGLTDGGWLDYTFEALSKWN